MSMTVYAKKAINFNNFIKIKFRLSIKISLDELKAVLMFFLSGYPYQDTNQQCKIII